MIDYTELRRLAEAASTSQTGTWAEHSEREDAYRLSAKPLTVIALLDENERLKLHIKHIGNDALRSENERLRSLLREWCGALTMHSRIELHQKTEKELK